MLESVFCLWLLFEGQSRELQGTSKHPLDGSRSVAGFIDREPLVAGASTNTFSSTPPTSKLGKHAEQTFFPKQLFGNALGAAADGD